MKTIVNRSYRSENASEFISEYRSLAPFDQFIAKDGEHEFFAIKIDDDCGVIINKRGRFVAFKTFTNCFSIGGHSIELESLDVELVRKYASYIK